MLDVLVLNERDAGMAEVGGADRLMLVGEWAEEGRSPEPGLVERVIAATELPVRPLLRLRPGYGTDGGEATRLLGLIDAYLDAGAEGFVLGFLNGHAQVDTEVLAALLGDGQWPWTFDALDFAFSYDDAWTLLEAAPRLDQVLTAGSSLGVERGLDELLSRTRVRPELASMMLVGRGLESEHVPWLARAGVRAFHVREQVRPQRDGDAPIDASLVRAWRSLLDDVVGRLDSAER